MPAQKIPAVFMRGGTSKAVIFQETDLPTSPDERDALFLAVMGSPDPNGRQLDGMGGGVSSVSKVCVVGPPTHPDADVDYTFGQVQIADAKVDFSGNCGNMSSAIGPFALDEGLVSSLDETSATVRIHNTNTRKIIHATFPVEDGRAATAGQLAIPGVAGTGAPIRLDFLDPGGATTGRLLPTGQARDTLDVEGLGLVEVSMVDAANACVFVAAEAVGLVGTELPEELNQIPDLLSRLGAIREAASVAMGITSTLSEARARKVTPFVVVVAAPQDADTLSGGGVVAGDIDLTARALSSGQPHRALPLTVSLCTGVAARIEGSVVHAQARRTEGAIRLGMPSGVIQVDAEIVHDGGDWHVERGMFYRTARRLFDGHAWY